VGKKTTKVTLDTNILISALGWRGNPHRILQKVINKEIELFVSHEQFEELARVLDYPKFEFTEGQKARFEALISGIANFIEPTTKLDVIKEDPSDNMLLECALVAKVNFIITGDRHLLSLRKLGRTRIVKASEFLKPIKI